MTAKNETNAAMRPRRMRRLTALVVAAMTMATVPAQAAERVKLGGSGAALALMKKLAQRYEDLHPNVHVEVLASLGSSGGIKALLDHGVDIALSTRPLKAEEEKKGAYSVEYASTPFVFVVHPAGTAGKGNVTTADIERIYSGEMENWGSERIRLVLRPMGETDTAVVKAISPALKAAVDAAHRRVGMLNAITDQENLDFIGGTRGAFGTATLVQVLCENRKVRILNYNGIRPDYTTAVSGRYPLMKPLYLVTGRSSSVAARDFIDFVLSPAAAPMMKKGGAYPVHKPRP